MLQDFTFDWPWSDFSIENFISQFDIFSGVDFSAVYSWLPSDIAGTISGCLKLLAIFAVLGILRRIWDALPIV